MKKVLAGIVVASVGFGGYFYAAPRMTLSSIGDALIAGDMSAAKELIDFDSMRSSVSDQMLVKIKADMKKKGKMEGPFEAYGMAVAKAGADQLADDLASPAGFMAKFSPEAKKEVVGDLFAGTDKSFASLSRFNVSVKVEEGKVMTFVLKRSGLSWRMVDMIIPL